MKFFFGLLAFIAATVVVVLLMVGLFRSFDETGDTARTTVSDTYDFDSNTAIDSVARYRISGPVVAEENHREIRVTISKNTRSVEILKGYSGAVESTKTYPNTPEAYKAFLGALDAARFSAKREGSVTDITSTCVTGRHYHYELAVGSDKKVDSWTTSCSLSQGTFAGNSQTGELFQKQIPDYSNFTSGLGVYSL